MLISRSCRSTLTRLYALGTPAATVVLLRNGSSPGDVQCLLVQKAKAQRFGGMWVFPGGTVDDVDKVHSVASTDLDVLATVVNTATRELYEETQLRLRPDVGPAFVSHWMPPATEAQRRGKAFSTFFLAAEVDDDQFARVDGSEIVEHQWLSPAVGLALHARGKLPLLPPTWLTLETIRRCCASVGSGVSAESVVHTLQATEPRSFETRQGKSSDGRHCFMWQGDSGWATSDPTAPGEERFRLLSPADEPLSSLRFELDQSGSKPQLP